MAQVASLGVRAVNDLAVCDGASAELLGSDSGRSTHKTHAGLGHANNLRLDGLVIDISVGLEGCDERSVDLVRRKADLASVFLGGTARQSGRVTTTHSGRELASGRHLKEIWQRLKRSLD